MISLIGLPDPIVAIVLLCFSETIIRAIVDWMIQYCFLIFFCLFALFRVLITSLYTVFIFSLVQFN